MKNKIIIYYNDRKQQYKRGYELVQQLQWYKKKILKNSYQNIVEEDKKKTKIVWKAIKTKYLWRGQKTNNAWTKIQNKK